MSRDSSRIVFGGEKGWGGVGGSRDKGAHPSKKARDGKGKCTLGEVGGSGSSSREYFTRVKYRKWDKPEMGHLVLCEYLRYQLQTKTKL